MLQSARLSGSIPSAFGNCTKLRILWLNENKLTGTLPSELAGLPELAILSVTSNSYLNGTVPSTMGKLNHCNVCTSTKPQSQGPCRLNYATQENRQEYKSRLRHPFQIVPVALPQFSISDTNPDDQAKP
jgi:hypothetical protein